MSDIEYTVRSLGVAARAGDLDKVKIIAEKVDVNEKDIYYYGQTALHWAANGGHREVCQLLLGKGCDIHAKDNNGRTALHHAARGGYREVCQLLLGKGCDIHAKDNNGRTALHNAAWGGHREVCQLLLEKGSDIHAKDKDGYTPLMEACRNGETETAEFLIQKGSHMETTNNKGKTAVDIALKGRHLKVAEKMIPDKYKLLLYCIEKNRFKFLERNTTELSDLRDENNNTSLIAASKHGRARIVRYLLESGKDVSAVNDEGDSALHLAAEYGNIRVIKQLLKYGASLHATNKKGYTPEVIAKLKKRKNISEFLAKVRHEKETEGQSDSYYDAPTPMPMTPGTFEHLLEDDDVAGVIDSDLHDTDDDSSQPSTSGYFKSPDPVVPRNVPLSTSTITSSSVSAEHNFAVPTHPAPRSGQASLPTQTQGNSGYISSHIPLPTSTITSSSVSADNFTVPTHPAPRSGQANVPIQTQSNSNDDSASKIEQLKLQLAAERREKEAEKRKNEAIIADKKRKDQAIADKKRKLSDQEKKLVEKDQVIADKKQKLGEKEQIITAKEQVITAKDEVINTKEHIITAKEQVITAKDEVINTKEQVIADKKQKLSEKQQIVEDKDIKLSQKEQVIAEKGKKLKKKDQRLKSIGKLLYESDDNVSGEKSDEESSVFHNERDSRIQGLFSHKADYKLSKKDFENVLQLMHYVCAVYYHLPAGTYNGTGLFLGLVEPQVQGSTVSINPSSVLHGASNTIPQVVVQSQPVLPSQPGTSTTLVPQTFPQYTGPPRITGPVAVILISGHNLEKWNPNVQPGELIFDWYERTGGNVLKSWSSGVIAVDTNLDYALLFTSDINVISRFNNVIPPRLMVNTNIPPSIPPKETTMTLIGHPRDSHMQGDHVEIIDKQTVLADKDFNRAISAAKFGAKKGANLHVVEENFSIIYNCTSFHGASGAPCFRLVDGNVELVCIHGGGIFLNTTNPTLQDKSDFEFATLMSHILSDINGKLPTLGLQWV